MKRFMVVILLVLGAFMLFSCGTSLKENTESPVKDKENENPNASPGAVEMLFGEDSFSQAEEMVKKMTLEEKVGQLFLVSLPEEYDVTIKPVTPKKKLSKKKAKKAKKLAKRQARKQQKKLQRAIKTTQELIKNYHIGGVYLNEKNLDTQKQTMQLVTELQSCASGGALYVAVEEEGGGSHSISGKVVDLKKGGYMSPAELAENLTVEHARQSGLDVAIELKTWGINLNLAPVADIAVGKNASYDMRCYGTEAEDTADFVSNTVEGMREGGVAVTLKHFPGFGTATGDCTEEILVNESSLMSLRSDDFTVYSEGIQAGADCVMVGSMAVSKITVNEIPAFLSTDIVTNILRDELAFEGVIMTPPLNEGVITKNYTPEYVAVEAVRAGCDMIVLPENIEASYEALLSEVRSGRLDEKVINTSVCRILQNKMERGILVLDNKN